jgi:hypothetical protein
MLSSEITVELSTPDDHALVDTAHLVLEAGSNGKVLEKADLLSQEATIGVWKTDQVLVM